MANDPNTYSYSSSSVMSYSSDGRGEPKYFQASKSTKKAPGGVSTASTCKTLRKLFHWLSKYSKTSVYFEFNALVQRAG